MTLLEQFDRHTVVSSVSKSTVALDREQIRRALAIAQAVREFGDREFNSEPSSAYGAYNWIMRRADELLEGR